MNWDEWTTGDLEQAQEDIAEVLRRRQLLATAAEQADTLARAVLAAQGVREGDPWRPPTGPHDAYPAGWVVSHDGATYRSLVPGNMEQPRGVQEGRVGVMQASSHGAWEPISDGASFPLATSPTVPEP